jgi:hypothetical protein
LSNDIEDKEPCQKKFVETKCKPKASSLTPTNKKGMRISKWN